MKCPLVNVKKVKKNERGSFDFRRDVNIEIAIWNDNSVVTIGSNAYDVQPIGSAKRWIKGKGKQKIRNPPLLLHIIEKWVELTKPCQKSNFHIKLRVETSTQS